MGTDILDDFSSQYNSNELSIIHDVLTANVEKIKQIVEKEKQMPDGKNENKRLLWQIILDAEKEQGMEIGSLTQFLIMTFDEPEKRREVLENLKCITDTRQRDIVLRTMTATMKNGNATLENIRMACCDDKNGIVINIHLGNDKWLLLLDSAVNDGMSPFGHWITLLSDKEIIYNSFNEACEKGREELKEINHDDVYTQVGSIVDRNSTTSLKDSIKKDGETEKDR